MKKVARYLKLDWWQRVLNGIDYTETYSPVMRYNTLRFLLTKALKFELKINHLHVCTAFLQGNLKDEINIEAPEGISVPTSKMLKFNRTDKWPAISIQNVERKVK